MGPHHLRLIFKTRLPVGVYVGLQATKGKLREVGQFSLAKKLPEMEDVVSTGPSYKGRHNEYSSILELRVRVHFVLTSMGLHCPVRRHGLYLDSDGWVFYV